MIAHVREQVVSHHRRHVHQYAAVFRPGRTRGHEAGQDQGAGDQHLGCAQAEHHAPEHPEPRGLQLEADDDGVLATAPLISSTRLDGEAHSSAVDGEIAFADDLDIY